VDLGGVAAGGVDAWANGIGQAVLGGQDEDVTGVFTAVAVRPEAAHHAVFGFVLGGDGGGERQR
jgi:hypothetical protein